MEIEINSIVTRLTFPEVHSEYEVIATKNKPYFNSEGKAIEVEVGKDYIIVPIDKKLDFRQFYHVTRFEIDLI
ncbi:hypothetical protein [Rufibacter immobilis]|uniref:hypothetical protein n=1 Tax=Rufibacter immobilis TaxID=1348778 RepID=UPI0035E9E6E5